MELQSVRLQPLKLHTYNEVGWKVQLSYSKFYVCHSYWNICALFYRHRIILSLLSFLFQIDGLEPWIWKWNKERSFSSRQQNFFHISVLQLFFQQSSTRRSIYWQNSELQYIQTHLKGRLRFGPVSEVVRRPLLGLPAISIFQFSNFFL